MRNTHVLPILPTWKFHHVGRLTFWGFAQTTTVSSWREIINNYNPTQSLWALDSWFQVKHQKEYIFFKAFVFFSIAAAILYFQLWLIKRAEHDATWTHQWTGEVGVEIGVWRGGGGRERGVRDARCLSLICQKNGKHVMIANAEQIGLEEKKREDRERRQMVYLAQCQQYQHMTVQGSLCFHNLTLVAACVNMLITHARTQTVVGYMPPQCFYIILNSKHLIACSDDN